MKRVGFFGSASAATMTCGRKLYARGQERRCAALHCTWTESLARKTYSSLKSDTQTASVCCNCTAYG